MNKKSNFKEFPNLGSQQQILNTQGNEEDKNENLILSGEK